MEFIIILLLALPGIGYLLQRGGITSLRETELIIPTLPVESIRSLLISFSRAHSWSLLHEDFSDEQYIFVFRSGQWGQTKDGVQMITISFFPTSKETRCFVRSESLFGQFYDFGINQKNNESVAFFLSEETKQDIDQLPKENEVPFLSPRPLVYPRYFIILISILVIIIGSRMIYQMTRKIVPGRVEITFKSYVSEEINQNLLTQFGAINCVHINPKIINAFECEVPVGEEHNVVKKASENPAVELSEPKFAN